MPIGRAGHITNEHQLGWSWLLYPFSVMCVLVIAITNHCLQLLTLVPAAAYGYHNFYTGVSFINSIISRDGGKSAIYGS